MLQISWFKFQGKIWYNNDNFLNKIVFSDELFSILVNGQGKLSYSENMGCWKSMWSNRTCRVKDSPKLNFFWALSSKRLFFFCWEQWHYFSKNMLENYMIQKLQKVMNRRFNKIMYLHIFISRLHPYFICSVTALIGHGGKPGHHISCSDTLGFLCMGLH